MESNDPFASMAQLCRVSASQESQLLLPGSDQHSDNDVNSGEITEESAAITTETDDDSYEVNQNPIEGENAYLFHTPPEFSSSVSDNEVFHTPRRASSSSLPSSQNQEPQPEGFVDGGGGGREEGRTEKHAGDSDDKEEEEEEEETLGLAVDLGEDTDLGFSIMAASESADRTGSISLVEVPEAVDHGHEMKVIRSESMESRVSEKKSVSNPENNDNASGLTIDTRIRKLKETLDRLNYISEKQKRWTNNAVVENAEVCLCPELSILDSSVEKSGLPEHKFASVSMNVPLASVVETAEACLCPELSILDSSVEKSGLQKHEFTSLSMNVIQDAPRASPEASLCREPSILDRSMEKPDSPKCELLSLFMNVIRDAPRDSPEARGTPEMNQFSMIEDLPAGMKVDDNGQSHGVKRKLELFSPEEMESVLVESNSGKENEATKGAHVKKVVLPQGASAEIEKNVKRGKNAKSGSTKHKFASPSMNVIQDALIDCSVARGTLEINNHSMAEYIPAEMKVDDNGKLHGGKGKLEALTEEMESASGEINSEKEQVGTNGTHDLVEKLVLPRGTSGEDEKSAKSWKRVSALVSLEVLEFLKMFAEDTDDGDSVLESMSLFDIAKMRGMTFP
ncbi:unnamed protein product [Linum trigynum]|uniref:Uncharacterized protein n=1 Tax=Linum trigynum TaxID=586398 RepID=A0AAV2DQX5_9ROSI